MNKLKEEKMTKEQALEKIEELKKYVQEEGEKEEKKVKIQIKTLDGSVLFESAKITLKEAVEEAVEQDACLRDANLEDANLRDACLEGANFRDAYLGGANLRDACLEGACLRDANLEGANLRGADLEGANLEGADLGGANLRDACLRDACLRGADFYRAKFFGRGGSTIIRKNQVDDFFKALGVVVDE